MNTEVPDMKDYWRQENEKLEKKLLVNEARLAKMTFDKAVTSYDKLLKLSILGRNLALVYFATSFIFAIRAADILYSIPAMAGALAMLWSFFSHRSLKSIHFESLSVVELQRSIFSFRVHTEKMKPWDLTVVMLWLITLTPAFLKSSFHIFLYDDIRTFSLFGLVTVGLMVVVYFTARALYTNYNRELSAAEHMLSDIAEFEKS